jgi:dihydropteroate synthase
MNGKNNEGNNTKQIQSGSMVLDLTTPVVMGIINCNEDSFYAGSRATREDAIQKKIDQLVAEGADIIDVGGRSSRPGSIDISVEEEINRIACAIKYLQSAYPQVWTSIDTTQSAVAEFAVAAGAHLVNDISSGDMDSNMIETVAKLGVPYVCMHMQGTPATMQQNPHYDDVVKDVADYMKEKVTTCQKAGINQVIIDPGFGFGKTIEHNYTLLHHLEKLVQPDIPLLVGFSRKSMIHKLLDITAEEALNGTTALNMAALLKGASLLRVHDVLEARQVIQLFNALK